MGGDGDEDGDGDGWGWWWDVQAHGDIKSTATCTTKIHFLFRVKSLEEPAAKAIIRALEQGISKLFVQWSIFFLQ